MVRGSKFKAQRLEARGPVEAGVSLLRHFETGRFTACPGADFVSITSPEKSSR